MNKQPYYHRAVVLFTATREVSQEELLAVLRKGTSVFDVSGVLTESYLIEEMDAEPGDPMDLV